MRLSDLAKLAGVSKTTVSYILSGKGDQYRISLSTQNKVLALAEQHDYSPHMAAKALREGSSRLIGVVLPNLQESNTVQFLTKIEKLCREIDFRLLISCSDSSKGRAQALFSEMLSQVDIAIMYGQCQETLDQFDAVHVQYAKVDKQIMAKVEAAIYGVEQGG
ncbi:LacI family DNA-binding transcriptional regulator [Vibrio sinaloensis]|uniref:LacI family DNA-binding transcriptional regulator n=1 Tax=Photobacterium sp. (strain ATCC 43367) TaxID=379097 RepID=UPI00204D6DAD|nr:LacI family DNA-binding transcriptional regulator [Vibrio sinaloensis]UPQ86882.1 LacI family DNA-binding transcriptional regulator [Vibrio sinaloensis]